MDRHDIEQLFQDEQRLKRIERAFIRGVAIWLVVGTALLVIAVVIVFHE